MKRADTPAETSPAPSPWLWPGDEVLDMLTRSVGATIALIDRDLRFAYVNESFARWFKLQPQQMVGCYIRDVYGEHNHARYMPFVNRALAGETVRYQRQVRNPAGVEEWHTICLMPCRDAAGKVRGVVAAALDVHELQVATEALRTANQRLSSHMANSPLAVIEMDAALGLVQCSDRARQMFGWSAAQCDGGCLLALLGAETDERQLPLQLALDRLRRREETHNRAEASHTRADGTTVHCQWFNSALTDAQGRVVSIMALVEDVSDRVLAAQRLNFLAQHDSLTKLLNRYAFLSELDASLARARRTESMVALLFIDLDGFKAVNDTLGHAAGDRLLCEVAARLQTAIRETDTVARLGGDEFVVLLDTEVHPDTAEIVSQRIIAALTPAFRLDGADMSVGASIGIASHPPLDGHAGRLMNCADQAMYEAKRAGKGGVRVFRAA